jgi:uncharacterized protein DUF4340
MTPKQLKTIALALVIALVLWGASELLTRKSDKVMGQRIFPALESSTVDSIVIMRKTDTLHLIKGRGFWTVNRQLASGVEMEGFFKQLADTTSPEIAAENSASHQRMGVDSVGSRRVKIFGAGQTRVDLFVGERGPDYQSSYVRRPNEQRVYLRYGPFAGFVDRGVDDWREHRMANVRPDSVASIEVQRKSVRYTLVKKDGKWQFANGGAVDTAAVSRLIKNLSPLSATGFATPEEGKKISFSKPDVRVVVKDAKGGTMVNLIADSMPNGYWVRADSGGPIYRNGVWIADEMAPWDTTVRAKK